MIFALVLAAAAQAVVVNIAGDGSSLNVPAPWEIAAPRFCPRGLQPLHGFRKGEVEASLCAGSERDIDARQLSRELLDEYRKGLFRGKQVGDISEEAKLKGGTSLWHFTYNTPPGFIMREPAAVMDAFFKRGKRVYFFVVTKPLKAKDAKALRAELAAFEKTAKSGFRVLERVSWPR